MKTLTQTLMEAFKRERYPDRPLNNGADWPAVKEEFDAWLQRNHPEKVPQVKDEALNWLAGEVAKKIFREEAERN